MSRSAATRSGCPLDLLLVASANPEDYTNRGRLITPLKDRFGSQIRTHYPLDVETELAIMGQEARTVDEHSGCRGSRLSRRGHRHRQPAREEQLARQPAQRRERPAFRHEP